MEHPKMYAFKNHITNFPMPKEEARPSDANNIIIERYRDSSTNPRQNITANKNPIPDETEGYRTSRESDLKQSKDALRLAMADFLTQRVKSVRNRQEQIDINHFRSIYKELLQHYFDYLYVDDETTDKVYDIQSQYDIDKGIDPYSVEELQKRTPEEIVITCIVNILGPIYMKSHNDAYELWLVKNGEGLTDEEKKEMRKEFRTEELYPFEVTNITMLARDICESLGIDTD